MARVIRLHATSRAQLDGVLAKLRMLITLLPQSQGSLTEFADDSDAVQPKPVIFRT